MVRISSFLLTILLSISAGYADGAWKYVTPIPTENVLNSVAFIDTNNGWIAGDSGTILRYENKQWRLESNPVSGTGIALRGIHFVNQHSGWIVGDKGTVLRYNGEEWQKLSVPVNDSNVTLYSVFMLSPQKGWIVGSSGTILYFDGDTWKQVESPVSCYFYTVQFLDETHGWIGGSQGNHVLFYNGTSWEAQVSDTSIFGYVFDIHMVNENLGFAVGGYQQRYYALKYDGTGWLPFTAENPTPEHDRSVMEYRSVYFLDASNGWISAFWRSKMNGGCYLFQSDGFSNEQKFSLRYSIFYDMCFLDSLHGWAVGLNDPEGGIVYQYLPENQTSIDAIQSVPGQKSYTYQISQMRGKTNHSVLITFQKDLQLKPVQGTLYSIYGRKISTTYRKIGKNRIVFDLGTVAPGNYILRLKVGDRNSVVKIPVIK